MESNPTRTTIAQFAESGRKTYDELVNYLYWEYGIVTVFWLDPVLQKTIPLEGKTDETFVFSKYHAGILFPEHACLVYMGLDAAASVDGIGPQLKGEFASPSTFQGTYYNKRLNVQLQTPVFVVCKLNPNLVHVPLGNGSVAPMGNFIKQHLKRHRA